MDPTHVHLWLTYWLRCLQCCSRSCRRTTRNGAERYRRPRSATSSAAAATHNSASYSTRGRRGRRRGRGRSGRTRRRRGRQRRCPAPTSTSSTTAAARVNRPVARPSYTTPVSHRQSRTCPVYMHTHTHTRARGWRRGVVVSGVRRMNEVNARRARLVSGWVTVFGWVYHLGM